MTYYLVYLQDTIFKHHNNCGSCGLCQLTIKIKLLGLSDWMKIRKRICNYHFFFHLEVGVGGCECYSSCWKGIKNQVDSNFCNAAGYTILFLSDNIVQYFVSRRSSLMLADICRLLYLSVTAVRKMWCIYFHWLFPVSNQTIAGCLQAVMSTQRSGIFKHRHFNLLWNEKPKRKTVISL